jgi:LysM repeat protein
VTSDGLPGRHLVRGAIVAFAIAVVIALYLLIAPPTLPHEQDRTGAAAPSASPAPGGARPAAGGDTPSSGGSATPAQGTAPASGAAPEPSPSPSGSPQAARRHTIQAGDTLLAIAEQYDTTVDAIRAANPGLSETALTIGQEITIPPSR